ncbi:hypothetical protein [Rhodococcus pyridinivorans]
MPDNGSMRVMTELERRGQLVEAMPGFPMRRHFESLNRASRVFTGNTQELYNCIVQFVGTGVMSAHLGEDYEHELVRLFHNYLASIGTLRDVQRTVHRSIWPRERKDVQSEWEAKTYTPKVQEVLGGGEFKFLQDLRNYTVHYALPVPSASTSISHTPGNPVVQRNDLRLSKDVLLQWSNWSSASRKFIESQNDWVDFLPAIENYSKAVREFYQWFWETVEAALAPEYPDFKTTAVELALYRQERSDWMNWRRAIALEEGESLVKLRRKLVETRQQRWEHGSRGWRVFSVDPRTGEAEQINEDPWGLPPRSTAFGLQ